MAVGSGLGASLGFAPETTFGTYVAPTKFVELTKEDLKKNQVFVQGGGLAAGQLAYAGSRRNVATESGSGSFEIDVPNKGFGLLLQALMGTTVTPVQQGATTAYLQTHAFADNFGKNLTIQKGVPLTTGTVVPYTLLGSKVTSAEFSCGAPGDLLNVNMEFDARQVVDTQTLAAPTYAAGRGNWAFKDGTLKLGTFGSEVAVSGVKKVTVKIARAMNTDRQYAGQAGLKAEPILNALDQPITGTVEADFLDKTVFADRFSGNTSTSMVWTFVGPQIAAPYNYTFTITIPMVFFEGDTPTVDGPDVVGGSFPFVARSDGTNPVATIAYTSTDTTL